MNKLLELLADGRFHSGEELGAALGVSRNAVWKGLYNPQISAEVWGFVFFGAAKAAHSQREVKARPQTQGNGPIVCLGEVD